MMSCQRRRQNHSRPVFSERSGLALAFSVDYEIRLIFCLFSVGQSFRPNLLLEYEMRRVQLRNYAAKAAETFF